MVAIICEYNPFHNGHAWHLAQTRLHFPGEPIVCIMSGYFVQRGGPAIISREARTRMALACGADAVVELPLAYATAGARDFAWGGVEVAKLLGANVLSFGSECGDVELLCRAANLTDSVTTPKFAEKLHEALADGKTFAYARQEALAALDPEAASILNTPNNILGVEYCRALRDTEIRPFTIRREGAGYDDMQANSLLPSSTYLRTLLTESRSPTPLFHYMPHPAWTILREETDALRAPVTPESMDMLVLSRLRGMSSAEFALHADVSEGLENRIRNAIRASTSLSAACELAKTRRYTLSRIRRACWRAFLRLPHAWSQTPPPYLRVLGLTSSCPRLNCSVPLLSRYRRVSFLDTPDRKWFGVDDFAADTYFLAYPNHDLHVAGSERKFRPVYIDRG